MLDKQAAELLNTQINKELFSSYLYLSFSNYYIGEGLAGFGNWFRVQAQEELDHALLILQYLQNNDVSVTLLAVDKPDYKGEAFIDPFKAALRHERYVTSLIHAIYDAAYKGGDFRTMQFLDWFIKEQGEEENTVSDLLKKMELFAADPKGLYLLDQELAARVYAAPTLTL